MQFANSLSQHLNNSNWWIHVTTLTIVAFMYVMTFVVQFSGSLVYISQYKWTQFCIFLLALMGIFSPVLLYSIFRNRLQVFHKAKHVLWFLIFMAYPFVFLLLTPSIQLGSISIMAENLIVIGIVLLIVEIFSHSTMNSYSQNISDWKEKVSPEWVVVVLFIMLAVFYASRLRIALGDINPENVPSGFSIGIQSALVVLFYYLFYLVNHYFLANKIFKKKGIVYYGFSVLACICIFFIPIYLLHSYLPAFRPLLLYKLGEDWIGSNPPNAFWSLRLGSIVMPLLLTIPLTVLMQWIGMAKRVNALEKEKTETELNLLKQQINPHFFFNTLNNIYSMSRKKNEDTPEAILQLSDLMRYVIYKGQEDTATLSQEIKYIEDYIDLQKLRLHQKFDYQFDINVTHLELEITPLLIIILVENAFKHGIEVASEDSYLHLSLEEKNGQLIFKCDNSIEDSNHQDKPGLGLKNLKRRLALIYPNAHTLDIEKSKGNYKATLRIDL